MHEENVFTAMLMLLKLLLSVDYRIHFIYVLMLLGVTPMLSLAQWEYTRHLKMFIN